MVVRLLDWLADQFAIAMLLATLATAAMPSCIQVAFSADPPVVTATSPIAKSDRERKVQVALAIGTPLAVAPMPHEAVRAKKVENLLDSDRKKKVENILHVIEPCECSGLGDCKCPPGTCKCESCRVVKRSPDYAAACAAVERGETILLAIGVPGGFIYHVDSLPGFAPGVYSCWKDASGRAVMTPYVASATAAAKPVFEVQTLGGCVNGSCASGNCSNATYSRRR